MVDQNQIERGLANYLDAEFFPKLHMEPWKEFTVATGMSIAIKRIGNVITALRENKALCMLGVVDENGNVDIDILAEQAKIHIPDGGLRVNVPILGDVVFHTSDVDQLYRKITGG